MRQAETGQAQPVDNYQLQQVHFHHYQLAGYVYGLWDETDADFGRIEARRMHLRLDARFTHGRQLIVDQKLI